MTSNTQSRPAPVEWAAKTHTNPHAAVTESYWPTFFSLFRRAVVAGYRYILDLCRVQAHKCAPSRVCTLATAIEIHQQVFFTIKMPATARETAVSESNLKSGSLSASTTVRAPIVQWHSVSRVFETVRQWMLRFAWAADDYFHIHIAHVAKHGQKCQTYRFSPAPERLRRSAAAS